MIENKEQHEKTLLWLKKFRNDLSLLELYKEGLWFEKVYQESIESQIESLMEEINDYEEQTKAWEKYLLRIGVTDLTNEQEINQKLDEVERQNPDSVEPILSDYETTLIEALSEISQKENKPPEKLNEQDLINWLLSLGD